MHGSAFNLNLFLKWTEKAYTFCSEQKQQASLLTAQINPSKPLKNEIILYTSDSSLFVIS